MVRIKHRYLLLNILFPVESSTSNSSSTSTLPTTQLVLSHHAPTPPHFHAASLVALIRDSVAELFGDYGVGVISGLKVVYFSPATSTAIVRCPRAGYRVVWAGVTFVKALNVPLPGGGAARRREREREGTGCVIRVVRVSGTIRKAAEEAVRRARREIVRVKMLDLDQEGGGGLLDGLLRGGGGSGQGGDIALGRDDEEAGIEDLSEGGEDVDDDSG